jgi:hypothetical protein
MADMRPRVLFVCTHNAARSQIAEAVSSDGAYARATPASRRPMAEPSHTDGVPHDGTRAPEAAADRESH